MVSTTLEEQMRALLCYSFIWKRQAIAILSCIKSVLPVCIAAGMNNGKYAIGFRDGRMQFDLCVFFFFFSFLLRYVLNGGTESGPAGHCLLRRRP